MRRKGSAKGESREGNWQFSLSNLADHPVRSGRTRLNNTLIGCFSFSTLSFLSSLSSQTWRPGSGGPGGLAGEKMLVLVQPWWLVLGSHHLMVNVAWSTGPATVWDNIITTIIWGSQPWPPTSTTQTTFTRHLWEKSAKLVSFNNYMYWYFPFNADYWLRLQQVLLYCTIRRISLCASSIKENILSSVHVCNFVSCLDYYQDATED